MASPSKNGITFNSILLSEYLATLKNAFANTSSDAWKEILNESPEAICADYAKIIADLIHNSASRVEPSKPLPRSALDLPGILQPQANLSDKKKYAEKLKQLREGLETINGFDAEVLESVGPDENNCDPLPEVMPLKKFVKNLEHHMEELASGTLPQLHQKLRTGEIIAWGLPSPLKPDAGRTDIPPSNWEVLEVYSDGSASGEGIRYVNILFEPNPDKIIKTKEKKARRTSGDRLKIPLKLLEAEMYRRHQNHDTEPTYEAECEALHIWSKTQPKFLPRKASGIERSLRSKFKAMMLGDALSNT